MTRLVSFLLITLGLISIVLGSALLWQRYNPNRLAFSRSYNVFRRPAGKVGISYNGNLEPKRLIVPRAGIDLPILSAEIKDGKWESTTEGVSYLSSTPSPGERGNSVLYGHNYSNLLGSLHKVRPGQRIEIIMSDGNKRFFTVAFVSVVTPDQTHILSPSADKRLTIYTCTGFLDSKRLVVTAIAV